MPIVVHLSVDINRILDTQNVSNMRKCYHEVYKTHILPCDLNHSSHMIPPFIGVSAFGTIALWSTLP